jgi:hypothetical protein
VIQLSTTQPRTTIITRHPPVLSGEGYLVGHSFARLMLSKMFLKAWHTSTITMANYDHVVDLTDRV